MRSRLFLVLAIAVSSPAWGRPRPPEQDPTRAPVADRPPSDMTLRAPSKAPVPGEEPAPAPVAGMSAQAARSETPASEEHSGALIAASILGLGGALAVAALSRRASREGRS